MHTEESRNARPERLLRLPEVLNRIGMQRAWLYRAMHAGKFPKPISPRDARVIVWPESVVSRWVHETITAHHAPTAQEEALLNERQLAERLGMSVSMLQKDRSRPNPRFRFLQLGRSIRYRWSDIQPALGGRRMRSDAAAASHDNASPPTPATMACPPPSAPQSAKGQRRGG